LAIWMQLITSWPEWNELKPIAEFFWRLRMNVEENLARRRSGII